jgi:serine/threonine-protein kinase
LIGKTISKYKIIEKLGEGAMGEVYLAEDSELKRKIALKFLISHYTSDPKVLPRFKREAQTAAAINHPNIITVYEIGEYNNQYFIAMEYIEGKALDKVLKENKLNFDEILNISCQVCEGLKQAHKKEIIHRDLKPGNIIIGENGWVKILDFGLAKLKTASTLTSASSTLGTLNYMSPEQVRSADVDNRSDIFSFGIILYEMITNRTPFGGEYEASVVYSILNENPEPLARYKIGVSERLQQIVDKALEKDPETRYQHIDELLVDLKKLEEADKTDKLESTEVKIQPMKTKEVDKKEDKSSDPSKMVSASGSSNIKIPKSRILISVAVLIIIIISVIGYQYLWDANINSSSSIPANTDPGNKAALDLNNINKFISEIKSLNDVNSLMDFLKTGQNQGRFTYGQHDDYYNLENKFVILIDEETILNVLLYRKEKFIDPMVNQEYTDLSEFMGKRAIWVELFQGDEGQIR